MSDLDDDLEWEEWMALTGANKTRSWRARWRNISDG